jgi:hypothetical protein
MPSYLRRFYIQKLIKVKTEEKKQMDKANKKPSGVSRPSIKR